VFYVVTVSEALTAYIVLVPFLLLHRKIVYKVPNFDQVSIAFVGWVFLSFIG
jgi:uncharacterized integral membrane protein